MTSTQILWNNAYQDLNTSILLILQYWGIMPLIQGIENLS
ncbi:MAG: hypothetical protein ACI9S8_002274 [Chlamydiales bacterium]|jgi:hypothetical protein